VLFSANSSDITSDPVVWPTTFPGGGVNLTTMGAPSTVTLTGTANDQLWETNLRSTESGFRFEGPGVDGRFEAPIPVDGASIVAAVRPIRYGVNDNWQSVVDIFYNRLVLIVRNGDGTVGAWVNGALQWSATQIPNGEITILSLVVQPDGSFKIFANGAEVLDNPGNGEFIELDPTWQGNLDLFGKINVGRNNPDGWTSFNGNIGDVAVYKGALDTSDREALEATLTAKYGTSIDYTITATELTAGGSITPVGAVAVPQQTDQSFTISTELGNELDDVVVDASSQGPITSYTFTNVTTDHTIDVTWNGLPVISGTVAMLSAPSPTTAVTASGMSPRATRLSAMPGMSLSSIT
jgi:hypothetical protein